MSSGAMDGHPVGGAGGGIDGGIGASIDHRGEQDAPLPIEVRNHDSVVYISGPRT